MKRLSTIILAVSVVVAGFALASCGDDDNDGDKTTALKAIADQYAGSYTATDSLNVATQWGYYSDSQVTYRITANDDGTINVTVPAETYSNTQVGNLTIGSYTISNISYNVLTGYTKAYKSDGISTTFQAVSPSGAIIINPGTYDFSDDACVISVNRSATGQVTIANVYKLGKSPMIIYTVFKATKQ